MKKCHAILWHVGVSIKSLKILKITYEEVHFQQSLLKDVILSKLSFRVIAFQTGTSHVIGFA